MNDFHAVVNFTHTKVGEMTIDKREMTDPSFKLGQLQSSIEILLVELGECLSLSDHVGDAMGCYWDIAHDFGLDLNLDYSFTQEDLRKALNEFTERHSEE